MKLPSKSFFTHVLAGAAGVLATIVSQAPAILDAIAKLQSLLGK
jgi:hypothetical protein